jgi:hypothetical protein
LAKPGQNYVKEESQLVITFLSPAMYNLLFALNLPIENFYDSINRLKIIFSWIHSRFHVNVSAWCYTGNSSHAAADDFFLRATNWWYNESPSGSGRQRFL